MIFGTSGKEYVTHERLIRDVEDEINAHQGSSNVKLIFALSEGRVSLLELQSILGVPLTQIQATCSLLLKQDPSLHILNDELIASFYLDYITEEINQTVV